MTPVLIAIIAVLAVALVALALYHRGVLRRHPKPPAPEPGSRRILFPFVGSALSQRALDAALRLARAESATLMPVFLARVPLTLPLDSPLPRQAAICLRLQEAIEQRAAAFGVPVDARVERGRTYRHALRQTIATERFERIVMAAATDGGVGGGGFNPDDVAWLLATAPGEIVVLRPGAEDQLVPVPAAPRRRGRKAAASRDGAPVRERERERDPVAS
jgi:nucleotide-binding universal stress UspA family protein